MDSSVVVRLDPTRSLVRRGRGRGDPTGRRVDRVRRSETGPEG